MAPDLDRERILGGFCLLAMAPCVSLMVLSEPITFNIQMLIAHLKIVISLSHTHICVQHQKDYNWSKKFLQRPETPMNIILIIYFILLQNFLNISDI